MGRYRGSASHSRFRIDQMGSILTVVGVDDGCADVKVDAECDSTMSFYLATGGRLVAAAQTAVQRIHYGAMKELGRVQFRMTTEPPVFDAHSVRLKEKLSVRDSADDEIRKSEGERVFMLRGGELVPNGESVWSQANVHP
jgi:hypothetical protein